jgi:hypothetical protein
VGGKIPTQPVSSGEKRATDFVIIMESTRAAKSNLSLNAQSRFSSPRLEDLVAQDDIISVLTNLIDSDNLPHLLLYGPVRSAALLCCAETHQRRCFHTFCFVDPFSLNSFLLNGIICVF